MNVDTSNYFRETTENGLWKSFPKEQIKPTSELTRSQIKTMAFLERMIPKESLSEYTFICHTCKLVAGPLHTPDVMQNCTTEHAGHNSWVDSRGMIYNRFTGRYD